MDAVAAFAEQAVACRDLGSPMYADLVSRTGDDIAAGGPAAEVVGGHQNDPGRSALALRVMGGVHSLVLAGDAPALARFYPSVGGEWQPDPCWAEFRAVLDAHCPAIRAQLGQPPQTNEVGRSAALAGGLLEVAQRHARPVRLLEIGCSAGLNLRADHYRYHAATGESWGSASSPVQLAGAWQGRALPTHARVDVVERRGADIAPIDPVNAAGRLALMAYVWPDQCDRFTRLRGALDVAAEVPAVVERADALRFVQAVELSEGVTTVLWHSVMWQYMPRDQQDAVATRIAELGSEATARRPFAHVCLEPASRDPRARPARPDEHPPEFLVALTCWPGGGREILGVARPHGIPVTWE